MKLENLICALELVKDKEQQFNENDAAKIIALWEKRISIIRKTEQLIKDNVSVDFINGWFEEMHKTEQEIRNYKAAEK
jgi:uncharacterized protein YeeX (DUF496 family)